MKADYQGMPNGVVNGRTGLTTNLAVRWLLIVLLLAAIVLEAYYIAMLRGTIAKQSEDLRQISVQLQTLRSESSSLQDELTSARKNRGEGINEHSPDR